MKVNQIGHNQIEILKRNGRFLVSYDTPVAGWVDGLGWIRTEEFHSKTTSKHINQWLGEIKAECVSQKEIDTHFSR